MTHQFSIGQFAKLTGLTPRALRIYSQEGLLQPEVINPETGYRYYSQSQSLIAERIRLLRSIDMPLEDIREVLSYPGTEICQELLQEHKQRIEAQLRCYQEALQTLEELSSRDVNAYPVAVKAVPEQSVIYVQRQTSLLQIETVRERAFGELYGFLRQENLSPTGPGFSANAGEGQVESYEEIDLEAECSLIEIGVPVAEVIKNACLRSRVWPGGKVAYAVHTGPYEPLFHVYHRITSWLNEQGLEPTGSTREIYHVGLAETRQRNNLKTEIQFYIR
jgi:DNA-binding transcriptional MerR regulator